MKYLVGALLMLAVIVAATFLDMIWDKFPAIGVTAGACFIIGTRVRPGDK